MNNINQLKENYKDTHPGLGIYLECMTRSFFAGLATFGFAFSGSYFGQKLIHQKFPYKTQTTVLVATIIGTVASYKVTRDRTKSCQALWMATDDKFTVLSDN